MTIFDVGGGGGDGGELFEALYIYIYAIHRALRLSLSFASCDEGLLCLLTVRRVTTCAPRTYDFGVFILYCFKFWGFHVLRRLHWGSMEGILPDLLTGESGMRKRFVRDKAAAV